MKQVLKLEAGQQPTGIALGRFFFLLRVLPRLSLSLSPIGWHTVGRRQPVAAAACEPAACRREQFTHAFHETHFARSHRPHTRRAAHLLVPHNSTSPPLELGAPHLLFRAREIPVLHYSTYIVRPPAIQKQCLVAGNQCRFQPWAQVKETL